MKIFHCVESYYPSVGGMQEVVRQLSERLVLRGHDVTVLTREHPERKTMTLNGVNIKQFAILGNPSVVSNAEEQAYVDFLVEVPADVVTFFAAQQWATDLALPVLSKIKARKVSVPTGYSGLYKPAYEEYFNRMKTYIHGYDMNVYLGHHYRDINFARQNNVTRVTIIPNAAAAEEFLTPVGRNVRGELGIPDNHFLLLHVGTYTGKKGQREAVDMFLRTSIDNATLLMVGDNSRFFYRQYLKHPILLLRFLKNMVWPRKRIIFDSFLRDFTVAAYQQADLFLFPSNIECSPIVLFEAGAAGLPFVSSDVGNASEISEWTGGGVIIQTRIDKMGFSHANVEAGARVVTSLLKDEPRRKQMGTVARQRWAEQFTWDIVAGQYEKLYFSLLENDHR